MRKLENRDDIKQLVTLFYSKLKEDDLISPIFYMYIQPKWDTHLDRFIDFWETNLFEVVKYKGSPMQMHLNLDKKLKHSIDKKYFDRWVFLWCESVDALYKGVTALKAKKNAKSIAIGQFMKVWHHKPMNH